MFAMVVALHRRGLFTWAQWSAALAREVAAHGGDGGYGAWLDTLEDLLAERGIAGAGELRAMQEAWRRAAAATPHGMPVLPGAGYRR